MNIWNAACIRQFLQERGAEPNKALGQNFLIDPAALEAILTAAAVQDRPVLEIGPGLGALTEPLCRQAKRIVAVEKDARMAGFLMQRVTAGNLTVAAEDFLLTDLRALFPEGECDVVGNLPYYATTPIVMKLLCADVDIPNMTLMLQKEAAGRLFAQPGEKNYTPLTVLAQSAYEIETILILSPASYWPQPGVDSTVVRLTALPQRPAAGFAAFLSAAFAMRRKTLANNLFTRRISRQETGEVLQELGVPPDARAEALAPETLYELYRMTERKKSAGNPDEV